MDMAEEDWIKIPNHHPPIVDEETFHLVQDSLRTRTTRSDKSATRKHFLKGKVVCGCCHHNMAWVPFQGNYFNCVISRDIPDLLCSGTRITEEEILKTLYPLLKDKAKKVLELLVEDNPEGDRAEVVDFVKEKRKLYEQFDHQEISMEEYLSLKTMVERAEQESKEAQQREEGKIKEIQRQRTELEQCREYAQKLKSSRKPNRELIEKLVRKVFVFPDKRLEVLFMYEIFETI